MIMMHQMEVQPGRVPELNSSSLALLLRGAADTNPSLTGPSKYSCLFCFCYLRGRVRNCYALKRTLLCDFFCLSLHSTQLRDTIVTGFNFKLGLVFNVYLTPGPEILVEHDSRNFGF